MERALELQAEILDEMGAVIGSASNPPSPGFGSHYIGTIRMGTDSEESVVNPSLRAHDLENLFVASSSVSVTAGAMNPTLTIAALALRLAEFVGNNL